MVKGFIVVGVVRPVEGFVEPVVNLSDCFRHFRDAYAEMERRWEEAINDLKEKGASYLSFSQGNTMRGIQYTRNDDYGAIVAMYMVKQIVIDIPDDQNEIKWSLFGM